MSGTALYRALVEAGVSETTAKEAADENDTMDKTLTELKVMVRVILAIVTVILVKSFF